MNTTNEQLWGTACHEAAHSVINHALAIRTTSVFIDSDKSGSCDPELLFQIGGGEDRFDQLDPITDGPEYVWLVNTLIRHAAGAYGGPIIENILRVEGVVHTAEDALDTRGDYEVATGDLRLATRGHNFVGGEWLRYMKAVQQYVATLLGMAAIRKAVESLAEALVVERRIDDSARIEQMICDAGVEFGAYFPAFCAAAPSFFDAV